MHFFMTSLNLALRSRSAREVSGNKFHRFGVFGPERLGDWSGPSTPSSGFAVAVILCGDCMGAEVDVLAARAIWFFPTAAN